MNKELSLVKESALKMAQLTSDQKNEVLQSFSELLITKENFLLEANHKDLEEQKGKVSKSIYQRLGLNSSKIKNLAQGMLDLKKLKDPVGEVTLKRKLDEGLILSKVSVPIGVLGVIFESRPDAAAQILSLVLKSGNATVLKGGKEAKNSNQAMKSLVDELNTKHSFLPKNWAVF